MKIDEISQILENTWQTQEDHRLELVSATLEGDWEEVVEMYKTNYEWIHKERINDSQDTAFHIAVENGEDERVAELVQLIIDHEKDQEGPQQSALKIPNVRGDTPLHLAASWGFTKMCYCIVGEKRERVHLLESCNNKGENPLFLAALNGHKDTFLYLHHWFSDSAGRYLPPKDLTRNNGDTILHCAIRREYFGKHACNHCTNFILNCDLYGLTCLLFIIFLIVKVADFYVCMYVCMFVCVLLQQIWRLL